MARTPKQSHRASEKRQLHVEQLENRTVPATLNGYAFFDTNANGMQDTGEGFAEGVGVTATPDSGSPVSTSTTAGGFYSLTLSPGSYSVNITAPAGYSVGTPGGGVATVIIESESDEVGIGIGLVGYGSGSGSDSSSGSGLPVVSMSPTNTEEGGGSGTPGSSGSSGAVMFTRSGGDTSQPLAVGYAVGGSATPGAAGDSGADYATLSGTVTFAPYETTAVVFVSAYFDTVTDPDETVTLTIEPTATYTLTGEAVSATAVVVITDVETDIIPGEEIADDGSIDCEEGDPAITDEGYYTFSLPDGNSGSLSFQIPWESVDAALAEQSAPLSGFALTLDGQTLDEGRTDVVFSSGPTGAFAYGELVGLSVTIDSSQVTGYPYASFSMTGGTQLTVTPAGEGQTPVTVTVQEGDPPTGNPPPSPPLAPPPPPAAPPTSATLTWDNYEQVDKPKEAGFDAMTAYSYSRAGSVLSGGAGTSMKKDGMWTFTTSYDYKTVKFAAVFNSKNSWVVKDQKTDALLGHEKLHLQIAEYIAEKAAANVPSFKSGDKTATDPDKAKAVAAARKEAQAATTKIMTDYMTKLYAINEAVQKSYDTDTNHGRKATEQADWASKYKQFVDAECKKQGWTK